VKGKIRYIGLTKNPIKRKSDHKRKHPKHEFILVQKFSSTDEASQEECRQITEHNTYIGGWNKDPGGNYGVSSGFTRTGIGGRKKGSTPWNKGLTKDDPRIKKYHDKATKTRLKNGSYKGMGKHLPKLYGDKNPMKQPNHRKRMSELAKTRYRVYNDDGSWSWGYRS